MKRPSLPGHPLQPADGQESRATRSRWKLRPMTPEAYYQHVTPAALGIPTTITISMFYPIRYPLYNLYTNIDLATTTIATRQTKRRLP